MKYLIKREIFIPSDIETVWRFFSDPKNLAAISPDYLRFKIINCPDTKEVYNDMVIEYKVSPVSNIPMRWKSLIQQVIPLKQFKDVQTKGPYRVWEHTHIFESSNEGVPMNDYVLYEMPYGWIGRFVHLLFVKKQLNELFDYRAQMIHKLFP